jgi:hypothetical protein
MVHIPQSPVFEDEEEVLIRSTVHRRDSKGGGDCEEDRTLRAVLVGTLREADRPR